MLYKLFIKLSRRTQNSIGTVLGIVIITAIASLLIGILFGVIGKLARLSFIASLARFGILIFLLTAALLIPVMLLIANFLIIDAIKRDGFKILFKRLLKTFIPLFILVIVFYLIKYKHLEWGKSIFYSLMTALLLLLKTEVDIFVQERQKEQSTNTSYDEKEDFQKLLK